MSKIIECSSPHGDTAGEPEQDVLLRMSRLVEHVFRVPIAYMALFGPDLTVVNRIGSGEEYWANLKTYPLRDALPAPFQWPNGSGSEVPGFVSGDVKFAAAAPLRSSEELDLGLLVIADTSPRPDFTAEDLDTLAELAKVLAGKMELRMTVCQMREAELDRGEAERRFRNIANSAPVLIIYSGEDGSASFVNRTWLEFTGRTIEEELGEGFVDRFHADYRDAVMQIYREAFEANRPLTQEFPMLRHDGEYRWMLARGMPRVRDDGTMVGYIGCLVDVTDQRQPPARG